MPKFHVHVEHIGAPKDGVAVHRSGVMEVEADDPAHAREAALTNLRSGSASGTKFGPESKLNVADDGSMGHVIAVHTTDPKMQVPKTPGASLAAPSTIAAPPVARGVNDKVDPNNGENDSDKSDPDDGSKPGDPPKPQPTHELT